VCRTTKHGVKQERKKKGGFKNHSALWGQQKKMWKETPPRRANGEKNVKWRKTALRIDRVKQRLRDYKRKGGSKVGLRNESETADLGVWEMTSRQKSVQEAKKKKSLERGEGRTKRTDRQEVQGGEKRGGGGGTGGIQNSVPTGKRGRGPNGEKQPKVFQSFCDTREGEKKGMGRGDLKKRTL